MTRFNRRDFLKGCCASAVAAGSGSRAYAYFAPPPLLPAAATSDTLVVVFLRGAMDGLSLLPPGAGSPFRADYETNRTNTRIPTSGTGAGLALNNSSWMLHPRATGLQSLFNAGTPRS
ncbi:MAG TPA: twin-arginine translocation signal domain-containing protein [Dokdonella sp.]